MAKPLAKLLKPPLFALLGVLLFHMLLTGSPIPLWHIEVLEKPFPVAHVADDHLALTSGQKLHLPLINSLPQDNAHFLAAIQEGVEVNDSGQVFGLLWVDRACGNDPLTWRKLRINLTDLSAALKPEGIDSLIIPREAIEFLAKNHRIELGSRRPNHLSQVSLGHMGYFRRQFEYSLAQIEQLQHAPP